MYVADFEEDDLDTVEESGDLDVSILPERSIEVCCIMLPPRSLVLFSIFEFVSIVIRS